MKKLVFALVVISLAFISCDNGAKKRQAEAEKAEKARQDSIAKAKEEEKARLVFEDSIAIFAWGDAKFGMTMKEVLKTKSFSDGDRYDNSIAMDSRSEFAIMDAIGMTSMMSVWADFGGKSNNELIRIRIYGTHHWNDFSDLVSDIDHLVKELTKKYGKPDAIQEHYSEMSFADLDKLKNIDIAQWVIGSGTGKYGTKYITIVTRKTISDAYEYNVDIFNTAFPKEKKEKTAAEIKAEQEDKQKKKDAVNNSF